MSSVHVDESLFMINTLQESHSHTDSRLDIDLAMKGMHSSSHF